MTASPFKVDIVLRPGGIRSVPGPDISFAKAVALSRRFIREIPPEIVAQADRDPDQVTEGARGAGGVRPAAQKRRPDSVSPTHDSVCLLESGGAAGRVLVIKR